MLCVSGRQVPFTAPEADSSIAAAPHCISFGEHSLVHMLPSEFTATLPGRRPPRTQAVVSYDRKHWARTDTDYDEKSGHLVIKHTPKYVRIHVLRSALRCSSTTFEKQAAHY